MDTETKADLQRKKQEATSRRIQNLHESIFYDIGKVFSAGKDARSALTALIRKSFNEEDERSDFDVNFMSATHEDATLLSISCRAGQDGCMKLLCEKFKADLNLCVEDSVSPLMLCAISDNLKGVDYCMSRGADPCMRRRLRLDKHREPLTAEQWAFQSKSLSYRVVRYLHAVRGVCGLTLRRDKEGGYDYLPCFCKMDVEDVLVDCSFKDCLQWCHAGCCGKGKDTKVREGSGGSPVTRLYVGKHSVCCMGA
jgi:hypothetical protein